MGLMIFASHTTWGHVVVYHVHHHHSHHPHYHGLMCGGNCWTPSMGCCSPCGHLVCLRNTVALSQNSSEQEPFEVQYREVPDELAMEQGPLGKIAVFLAGTLMGSVAVLMVVRRRMCFRNAALSDPLMM